MRMKLYSTRAASLAVIATLLAIPLLSPASALGQYAPPPPEYPPASVQYPAGEYPPPSGYPAQYSAPAVLTPDQLDNVFAPIALYPDPLLAQVLAASIYWNQIPDAAAWADQHSYLSGDALAGAIYQDNLPWDPSVLALLPFPSVLDMMARDPGWTQALGNAVLADRGAVMDAVQALRQRAMEYGYLRSNGQYSVLASSGVIQILPAYPGYVYVPVYNPVVVFAPPRRGVYVGEVIAFGPRVLVDGPFAAFGWNNSAVDWRRHTVIIDRSPRTSVNRGAYARPYVAPGPRPTGPRVENHELRGRQESGRGDQGRRYVASNRPSYGQPGMMNRSMRTSRGSRGPRG